MNNKSINQNPWQVSPAFPPSYEAKSRVRFLRTLQKAEEALTAVEPGKTIRILEVAAGGGFNAACLVEPNREVIINDIRPLGAELDYWTTGKDIQFLEGNFFDFLPEKIGKFDLILACEVIEHVAHGNQFAAHLKSFLNPNGVLIITTPNGLYFRSKLPTYGQITNFSELEKQQFKPDSDGHLYLYTPKELATLFQSTGLNQVKVYTHTTPWISGNAGFRIFPQWSWLFTFYYLLDYFMSKISDRLNTNMIMVAENKSL